MLHLLQLCYTCCNYATLVATMLHLLQQSTLWRGITALHSVLSVSYILAPRERVPFVKIGTIQRRLAWPLRKDDTLKSRSSKKFLLHLFHAPTRINYGILVATMHLLKPMQYGGGCYTALHSVHFISILHIGPSREGATC